MRPSTSCNPWVAAAIGVLINPIVAMLYIRRGRLALAYFAFALAILIFVTVSLHIETNLYNPVAIAAVAWATCVIVGGVHAFILVRSGTDGRHDTWYSRWYCGSLLFLIFLFLFLSLIRVFLFEPFSIPSPSMLPGLKIGDQFFAKNYAYASGRTPQRGDVAVFKSPSNNSIAYVKRIIGLPGETVEIKNGFVLINGQPLFYQNMGDGFFLETTPEKKAYPIMLVNSPNLRNWGPLTVPGHSYFMLGDNRDKSSDSRNPKIGFVAEKNITGRAIAVYFNQITYDAAYKLIR